MLKEGQMFVPQCSDIQDDTVTVLGETVGDRSIIYRLGDSEIFTYANQNTMIGGQRMIDVIPRMVVADNGFVQLSYSDLDKTVQYELFEGPRYKINCKKVLRSLIDTGALNMVYSDQYALPTCVPYIVQGSGRTARVFLNITPFVQLDQYGKVQVVQGRNYNGLMAIIMAAAVVLRIARSMSTLPADMADGLVLTYSSMLERTINSIVHMDPIQREKIRYLASEFSLIQMYGTEKGQELFFSRYTKFFPKLTKLITDTIDANFQEDAFDKLSSMITEMKRIYPSMKGLDHYMVLDKWIRLYGASTSMSIDYMAYHIYTMCMVLFESPLINRMALEPVMEKNRGTEMYRRIQIIVGEQ